MVTRCHFSQLAPAQQTAEAIAEAGHEVALITERLAGEDDDEGTAFVVAFTADRESIESLVNLAELITTD